MKASQAFNERFILWDIWKKIIYTQQWLLKTKIKNKSEVKLKKRVKSKSEIVPESSANNINK